ncbi:MAG: hypothetical protein J6K39_03880 [Clostridia bacterium]|nr:hypothetical protein [Clostridia bacterium]
MRDFSKEKQKLKCLFEGRPGFTDEVVESITASYLFFGKNYPEKIARGEIPDAKSFKLNDAQSMTLADIYLNRIYNNVKEFVHSESKDGCSEFVASEQRVYVPDEKDVCWDGRVNMWGVKTGGQKEGLRKKIRAKVITHELIHAASFNGTSIGFVYTSGGGQIDQDKLKQVRERYKTHPFNCLYGQNLEEVMTEILALNIVGNDNLISFEVNAKGKKFAIKCRNRDSSNSILNPIAECFCLAYGDVMKSKFTDGLEFLAWFNDNNELEIGEGEQFSYNVLCRHLDNIKDFKRPEFVDDTGVKKDCSESCAKAYAAMEVIQSGCLNRYQKHLKLESKEDVAKCVQDCIAFNDFALREDGKVVSSIQLQLADLKSTLKNKATQLNLDFDKILAEEREKVNAKRLYVDEPYKEIKESRVDITK